MHYLSSAWITTTFEGWHAWPDAPQPRGYLASPHRHLFYVRAEVTVGHDDREIEFHDLMDFIVSCLPGPDLGAQSCEMIARKIVDALAEKYPNRAVGVSVSEDNEVGAVVRFTP